MESAFINALAHALEKSPELGAIIFIVWQFVRYIRHRDDNITEVLQKHIYLMGEVKTMLEKANGKP